MGGSLSQCSCLAADAVQPVRSLEGGTIESNGGSAPQPSPRAQIPTLPPAALKIDTQFDLMNQGMPTTPTGDMAKVFKFYCPLCCMHFQTLFKTSCCCNYICKPCTLSFIKIKLHLPADHEGPASPAAAAALLALTCPHCATAGVSFAVVTRDETARMYAESPATRAHLDRIAAASTRNPHSASAAGSAQSTPMGRAAAFKFGASSSVAASAASAASIASSTPMLSPGGSTRMAAASGAHSAIRSSAGGVLSSAARQHSSPLFSRSAHRLGGGMSSAGRIGSQSGGMRLFAAGRGLGSSSSSSGSSGSTGLSVSARGSAASPRPNSRGANGAAASASVAAVPCSPASLLLPMPRFRVASPVASAASASHSQSHSRTRTHAFAPLNQIESPQAVASAAAASSSAEYETPRTMNVFACRLESELSSVADANDASHSSRCESSSSSSSSDASSTSSAGLAALALPSLDLPGDPHPQHSAAPVGDAALASAGTFSRFLLMNAQPNPMLTIVEENSADLSSMTPEKRASVRSVMYTPVGGRGDREPSSWASAGAAVRAPHGVPSPLASSPSSSSSSSSSSSVAFYSHATGESTPQSRRLASPSFASSPVADRVVRSAAAESTDDEREPITKPVLPVLMSLPAHDVPVATSATVHPLPLDLISASSISAASSSGSATGALFVAAADASLCLEPSGDHRQMNQHDDAGQHVPPLALQPTLALAAASEPSALRAAAEEESSASPSSSSSSVYLTASAAEYSAASAQLQLSARGTARLDAAQARLMLAVSAPATSAGAGASAAAAASKGSGD